MVRSGDHVYGGWKYFRYVMHLTSVVKGQLLPELSIGCAKINPAAGTVSGHLRFVPCRIYELEQEKRRGIYAGAIGYLSATGDMDFAIAIRTMIHQKSKSLCSSRCGCCLRQCSENEFYKND